MSTFQTEQSQLATLQNHQEIKSKEIAIVICSIHGDYLSCLLESLNQYVPKEVVIYLSIPKSRLHITNLDISSDISSLVSTLLKLELLDGMDIRVLNNEGTSFGDSYNQAVKEVFKDFDFVVLANDDIVLRPDTWKYLMEDLTKIDISTCGLLGCRSDRIRGRQNVRLSGGTIRQWQYEQESRIEIFPVIAPVFAFISKKNWIDFPLINWYSDDIQSYDLIQAGKTNYVGTFYVHHIFATTCGLDGEKLTKDAKDWVSINRPELLPIFFTEY